MIISPTEMLNLPNFGHMTTSTIIVRSRNKALMMTPWTEIIISKALFQKAFILTKSRVANLADIIKIFTMFIKTTLKDSN